MQVIHPKYKVSFNHFFFGFTLYCILLKTPVILLFVYEKLEVTIINFCVDILNNNNKGKLDHMVQIGTCHLLSK